MSSMAGKAIMVALCIDRAFRARAGLFVGGCERQWGGFCKYCVRMLVCQRSITGSKHSYDQKLTRCSLVSACRSLVCCINASALLAISKPKSPLRTVNSGYLLEVSEITTCTHEELPNVIASKRVFTKVSTQELPTTYKNCPQCKAPDKDTLR